MKILYSHSLMNRFGPEGHLHINFYKSSASNMLKDNRGYAIKTGGDRAMRITEIEAKLKQGDCSEEMIDLFITALKRAPKNSRCQHCYSTAALMPSRCHSQAISLIQYGLSQHCNSWSDRMRSYHNMAIILEAQEDYAGAKKAYSEALSSVAIENQSEYDCEYAAHILRMEMHISNFEYTEELESWYHIAVQANAFAQAFQSKRFYRLLAEIIISLKHNDLPGARRAFEEANDMLQPGHLGALTLLLKRKGFRESTGATKAAQAFLRRVKRIF